MKAKKGIIISIVIISCIIISILSLFLTIFTNDTNDIIIHSGFMIEYEYPNSWGDYPGCVLYFDGVMLFVFENSTFSFNEIESFEKTNCTVTYRLLDDNVHGTAYFIELLDLN